ncbi:hypothetical protein SNE40_021451 [Patella caerulea]|uniref:Uncharacterized protein n=1 Tax=Patella caerulea TaxID=87958 RepID=A0AAN8IXJ4_PATCE
MAHKIPRIKIRQPNVDDKEQLVKNSDYEFEDDVDLYQPRVEGQPCCQEMIDITNMEDQAHQSNAMDNHMDQNYQSINQLSGTGHGHPLLRPMARSRATTPEKGNTRRQGHMSNLPERDALCRILGNDISPDRFMSSQGSPYMNNLLTIVSSTDDGMHQKNIMLSKRIPTWVWYLLAKSLGIKLTPTDKPIAATVLHILTMLIALAFAVTGLWFVVSDILSEYSKTTVLIGTVAILLGFSWICMGIYSHKLAGRLFSNKNFVESVRMHAKTFLKISTVGLVVIVCLIIVGIQAYENFTVYTGEGSACKLAEIYPVVCDVMYGTMMAYLVIGMIWNIVVGCVLLSVCRTHTISIRRFMRELALDSKIFEMNLRNEILGQKIELDALLDKSSHYDDLSDWFVWDDRVNTDPQSDDVTSQKIFIQSIVGQEMEQTKDAYIPKRQNSNTSTSSRDHNGPNLPDIEEQPEEISEENYTQTAEGEADGAAERDRTPPQIMSNEGLLFSYWKLSQRLRVTSRYLQRWLSSLISFILIWCADYIMYWTTHSATLTGILQFILPLLILLIICSAYAEVNSEGQRMLRCICPTEERMSVIYFMSQQPLQMQVFSFPITYNALLGVILAFSVAIASRIILDEVLK